MSAAIPETQFVRGVAALSVSAADVRATSVVVVVDLARHAAKVLEIRATVPDARIVGFAPHVDEIASAADQTGVDVALPRSRFFHDVRAAIGYS